MERSERITITVSPEEKDDFRTLAEKRRKDMSEFIREVLNREVENSKKEAAWR